MVRTQIMLDEEQHRLARVKAQELGVSLAEYIRRLLARDLGADDRPAIGIDAVFALGDSGGSDVGSDRDAMVAAAIGSDRGLDG